MTAGELPHPEVVGHLPETPYHTTKVPFGWQDTGAFVAHSYTNQDGAHVELRECNGQPIVSVFLNRAGELVVRDLTR